MTLTEARDFLRAELLAVAAAAVPGQEGVVTHDPGPVNPNVLSDGRGPATICSITVENGDPNVVDPAAQVAAAAAELTARGWQTESVTVEGDQHRVGASRDGYQIAVYGWNGDWHLTLAGETPQIAEQ